MLLDYRQCMIKNSREHDTYEVDRMSFILAAGVLDGRSRLQRVVRAGGMTGIIESSATAG